MNVRLIKLTGEYYTQLSEMIDEWKLDHKVNQGNRSPWAIFKNDYHDFEYYLNNLEINAPTDGKVPDSVYFLLDVERQQPCTRNQTYRQQRARQVCTS